MPIGEVVRTTGKIGYGGFVNVDLHVVIEGRKDFLEMHRAFISFAAQPIG